MNKRLTRSLYVGALLIILTLIIFFVPNFGEERTDIQYAKLGFLLLSEVILTSGFVFLFNNKKMFLRLGIVYTTVMCFIANFLFIVIINDLKTLTTAVAISTLLVLVIVLAILNFNAHLYKKSMKINEVSSN